MGLIAGGTGAGTRSGTFLAEDPRRRDCAEFVSYRRADGEDVVGRILPEKPYREMNRALVDEADVLVAAPREQEGEPRRSGVWATIWYARKKGKRVVVRSDGPVEDSGTAATGEPPDRADSA